MEFDPASTAYIIAGLRIGQDLEGFVDAYYGPESLRQAARAVPTPSLAVDAAEAEVANLEEGARKAFFEAQLNAMRELLEPSDEFLVAVERTYGTRPAWAEPAQFADARNVLDILLEGRGGLAKRLKSYRDGFEVDPAVALSVAAGLAGELRRRTSLMVDLPDGEDAEIILVEDQPWSGYNWYLGEYRSRIEINTDLPILASNLPDLIAHEVYCGHHTEGAVKEAFWARERGWGEASIALLMSPQALISEGIATNALDVLVPTDEWPEWVETWCYQPASMNADASLDRQVQAAQLTLQRAYGNAAIMLHDRGASEDETADYLIEEAVIEPERARQMIRFITTPNQHGYIFNYTEGYDAVSSYLAASPQPLRSFRRLLEEHWTPGMLTGSAAG